MMLGSGYTIVFVPLVPWPVVWGLVALALGAVVLAFLRGLAGAWLRALGFLVIVLALLGPHLQREERRPLGDRALILVDQSGSNRLGERALQTARAEAHLAQELRALNIEPVTVSVADAPEDGGTRLFSALRTALADLPRDRLAGVFVIWDAIAHDSSQEAMLADAPLHHLLTGTPTEWDRRLVLQNVPAYAILGEPITITLQIEETGAVPQALRGQPVRVGLSLNGGAMSYAFAPSGQDLSLDLVLERAGLNVLHIVLEPAEGELTARNNEAVVQINGIRDRLRVLLVSGEPHAGQRTWRNILKSDPSVDLVHFTILRPPDKYDGVPVNELSLIAFPTRELFVEKIDEFDLIIFDRYRRRGILPNAYFENIRHYVNEGGALLVVAGPETAGAESIFYSPLGRIWPAEPTARLIERAFWPRVSELGRRHPVTADLPGANRGEETPSWGRWLRLIELNPQMSAQVVMEGAEGRPLLVLDRVGRGRVALLASDQAWLWDRGFDGGGPQGELLRRLAHWLMGEPELEEEALRAEARGLDLFVVRRSLEPGPQRATVEGPEGSAVTLDLVETAPGRHEGRLSVAEPGVWRVRSGTLDAVAVLGAANPREYQRTIPTPADLLRLSTPGRGAIWRLSEGLPAVRAIGPGRQPHGRGWLGVVPQGAYEVTDLRLGALLPAWVWLLMGASPIVAAWLIEGRTPRVGQRRSGALRP